MSAFTSQTYNLLSNSLLFAVSPALPEPGNWSGTNPPGLGDRMRLRQEAEMAINIGNPAMDNTLLNAIWNAPVTEFEIDHVIIGAGYAAVINASTLNTIPVIMPNGLPSIIMIGESEPWSEYKEKLMGQSPTNLSPSAFRVLPLHLYGSDYPRKPQKCLKPANLLNCYLSSENFSLSIALTRKKLAIPALKGTVKSINTQGNFYVVTVLIKKGTLEKTVAIKTKKLDVASGPGPPRKLPNNQFDDNIRQDLRIPTNGFKRHLFGGEALKEQEDLPPAEEGKKILIYGGSPTSAWVYERLFEVATIFKKDMQTEPYEVIWVAPLLWKGTGEDDLNPDEKKKIAFGAIDIGLRNKMVLQHSEKRRFVAEIKSVTKSGDQVKVKFSQNIGGQGDELVFDQIIESIGLDPHRPGGVNNLLTGFQGAFRIIDDRHGDRPLGLELDEGHRKLRVLGAAAVAASNVLLPGAKSKKLTSALALSDNMSSSMLLSEDYADKMSGFLESLPEEVRVPPGITVAGVTISRANIPDYALSTENKININTASLEELKAREIDVPDATLPLFSTQEAEGIVECRKNMVFGIPPFPGQPSGSDKHWIPGFISILKQDIESCEELGLENYDQVKEHIRV